METRLVRLDRWRWRWVTLLGILAVMSSLAQERPLSLAAHPPETGLIGRPLHLQLEAYGGVASYNWRVADDSGPLPPGLQLDPRSGLISGVPSSPGSFSFKIAVTDSADPPSTDAKTFVIEVPDALNLDWRQTPHISKEGITGSVVVSNQTGHAVDLTVIIVAVNEVGKAFALAEQHFLLNAESDSPTIAFGADAVLPFGKYTIHADAVGEVASENQIYRTRKQTADDFVIKQQ
jgi:Putative Ig domain